MLKRVLIVLLMFSSGALAGVLVAKRQVVPNAIDYPQTRAFFVNRVAKQFGYADTVILGDSLIEYADFRGACGRTFNGGIAGAKVADLLEYGPEMLAQTQPETVVIAIGANHFQHGNEIELFRVQYPILLEMVADHRLVLVGVQNSEEADKIVQEQARRIGAPYVAPIDGPFLEDGLHHAPQGELNYRAAIVAGCESLAADQA